MLNFLRIDLVQFCQSSLRLYRKFKPELLIIILQILLQFSLSFLLSLAPYLLAVKLSIWILGTIIFFVSVIFLEYERTTHHILTIFIATFISFLSLVFGAQYYALFTPIWISVLWKFVKKLAETSNDSLSKPQVLFATQGEDLSDDISFYSSSSNSAYSIKQYIRLRDAILDSFLLIALFSFAPYLFPQDLILFLNLFNLSLTTLLAYCSSFIFYLYLFHTLQLTLFNSIRMVLFSGLIFLYTFNPLTVLIFWITGVFYSLLVRHFSSLWLLLLVFFVVQLGFNLSLHFISEQTQSNFYFFLFNEFQVLLTVLLFYSAWNPFSPLLMIRDSFFYLMAIFCGIHALYFVCELLNALSYQSLTLFLNWQLAFTVYRKLIILALLSAFISLIQLCQEDEFFKSQENPSEGAKPPSTTSQVFLNRVIDNLDKFYKNSYNRVLESRSKYKGMMQSWRNYLSLSCFLLSVSTFSNYWLKMTFPFMLLLIPQEIKFNWIKRIRGMIPRIKSELDYSDSGLLGWAFYSLVSLLTLSFIFLKHFLFSSSQGLYFNLFYYLYLALMPKEYQIILNYSFTSKPTSFDSDISIQVQLVLFLLFTLPSLIVTLAQIFCIGNDFTQRLLMFLFPLNLLNVFFGSWELHKLVSTTVWVSQGWFSLKLMLENDNLLDEDDERFGYREKESGKAKVVREARQGMMQSLSALTPMGGSLGGLYDYSRSY